VWPAVRRAMGVPAGHQLPAFWTMLRSVGCFGVDRALLGDYGGRAAESFDRLCCEWGERVGAEGRDGWCCRGQSFVGRFGEESRPVRRRRVVDDHVLAAAHSD
jgi:hypothetical protein